MKDIETLQECVDQILSVGRRPLNPVTNLSPTGNLAKDVGRSHETNQEVSHKPEDTEETPTHSLEKAEREIDNGQFSSARGRCDKILSNQKLPVEIVVEARRQKMRARYWESIYKSKDNKPDVLVVLDCLSAVFTELAIEGVSRTTRAKFFSNRSTLWADLGVFEAAVADGEHAVELSDGDIRTQEIARWGIGTTYWKMGDLQKAIFHFERYMSISGEKRDSHEVDAWLFLARLHLGQDVLDKFPSVKQTLQQSKRPNADRLLESVVEEIEARKDSIARFETTLAKGSELLKGANLSTVALKRLVQSWLEEESCNQISELPTKSLRLFTSDLTRRVSDIVQEIVLDLRNLIWHFLILMAGKDSTSKKFQVDLTDSEQQALKQLQNIGPDNLQEEDWSLLVTVVEKFSKASARIKAFERLNDFAHEIICDLPDNRKVEPEDLTAYFSKLASTSTPRRGRPKRDVEIDEGSGDIGISLEDQEKLVDLVDSFKAFGGTVKFKGKTCTLSLLKRKDLKTGQFRVRHTDKNGKRHQLWASVKVPALKFSE